MEKSSSECHIFLLNLMLAHRVFVIAKEKDLQRCETTSTAAASSSSFYDKRMGAEKQSFECHLNVKFIHQFVSYRQTLKITKGFYGYLLKRKLHKRHFVVDGMSCHNIFSFKFSKPAFYWFMNESWCC